MNTPFWQRWSVRAQQGFALWVLLGALWGWWRPDAAATGRDLIPTALALIMLGMGLTLTWADFAALRRLSGAVLIGLLLQYTVMPLVGWGLAWSASLPPALAVGVVLVGAAPGGTASNVVTYLAGGRVALSVAMTAAATLLCPLLTPVWVWLAGSQWVEVQAAQLLITTLTIVLVPVVAGVTVRRFWNPPAWLLSGGLPLAAMAVIAWIVGVIVGLNAGRLTAVPAVAAVVVAHNAVGLILGYGIPAWLGFDRQTRRAVAFEVGMQNSGLAVALAVKHFAVAAAVPGALFSVWHNVTGALLAGRWRRRAEPT